LFSPEKHHTEPERALGEGRGLASRALHLTSPLRQLSYCARFSMSFGMEGGCEDSPNYAPIQPPDLSVLPMLDGYTTKVRLTAKMDPHTMSSRMDKPLERGGSMKRNVRLQVGILTLALTVPGI
jgi:hypothetical protein